MGEVFNTLYIYLSMLRDINRRIVNISKVKRRHHSIRIDPTVEIRNPDKLVVGEGVEIRRHVFLNGRSDMEIGIEIGEGSCVRDLSYLDCYGGEGYIRIGKNVGIGQNVYIGGNGGVEIHSNVMISGHTYIVSATHNFDPSKTIPYHSQGEMRKKIVIGKNAWIASNCVVLNGVNIGPNAVVGAGSVVVHDIPENCLAVGSPAKLVREFGKITR